MFSVRCLIKCASVYTFLPCLVYFYLNRIIIKEKQFGSKHLMTRVRIWESSDFEFSEIYVLYFCNKRYFIQVVSQTKETYQ